ncbi:uncharacterized protein LOC143017455 [Oratosquilla oratoria]|uniref:uncharacterized protein LOC143017455 n=1 Tax=Oratosquilla oratoria TaxID=337810 RepID=UPI003F76A988
MKRGLEEGSASDVEKKRKRSATLRVAGGGHDRYEQRRGAAWFSPSRQHRPPLLHAPRHAERLAPLVSTQDPLLASNMVSSMEQAMDAYDVDRMEELVRTKMLLPTRNEAWNEDCEAMAAFICMAFLKSDVPSVGRRVQALTELYLRKWHDTAASLLEVVECGGSVRPQSFLCFSMFYFVIQCVDIDVSVVGGFSGVSGAGPKWLERCIGSSKNTYSSLNKLLVSSILYRKQEFEVLSSVPFEKSYTGHLVAFLKASALYKLGRHQGSLQVLRAMIGSYCCKSLQYWTNWLAGLNLMKLGNLGSALQKLQDTVDEEGHYLALYNIAQLFHRMEEWDAELETLSLLQLAAAKYEKPHQSVLSLQEGFLRYHHPEVPCVDNRATYHLACRCLQQQMYKEAAVNFEKVLEKLQGNNDGDERSLLLPGDSLPKLPPRVTIATMAAMAFMLAEKFDEVGDVVAVLVTDVNESEFSNLTGPMKTAFVMTVLLRLIKITVDVRNGKVKAANMEATRLEMQTRWISSSPGDLWEKVLLLYRRVLYDVLTQVQQTLGNHQNAKHLNRLASQCKAFFDVAVVPSNLECYEETVLNCALHFLESYPK